MRRGAIGREDPCGSTPPAELQQLHHFVHTDLALVLRQALDQPDCADVVPGALLGRGRGAIVVRNRQGPQGPAVLKVQIVALRAPAVQHLVEDSAQGIVFGCERAVEQFDFSVFLRSIRPGVSHVEHHLSDDGGDHCDWGLLRGDFEVVQCEATHPHVAFAVVGVALSRSCHVFLRLKGKAGNTPLPCGSGLHSREG